MNIELLELAAECLGPLVGEVVFLGGATLELWITDPGAPPVRPTNDVDVVVEVTTRPAFHTFEDRLRSRCFSEDQEGGVICRWRHRDSGLILDVMPDDPRILGFQSRWQGASILHAVQHTLASGAKLRAVSPPYLLATKIEAFRSRGEDDFIASRDFSDIVTIHRRARRARRGGARSRSSASRLSRQEPVEPGSRPTFSRRHCGSATRRPCQPGTRGRHRHASGPRADRGRLTKAQPPRRSRQSRAPRP